MVRKRITEKKHGGEHAAKENEDAFVLREVSKALEAEVVLLKKKMKLEPTQDATEKQVRLVIAILKMNISALTGTMEDAMKEGHVCSATERRKKAIERLIKITKEFEQVKHTEESFDKDARAALDELANSFQAFGDGWDSIRHSIVQLAMDQIADIKHQGQDPLRNEKAELERLEKKAKDKMEKEQKKEMERKAAEKKEKEKEKKKNKKKTKKSTSTTNDDFGEERVPSHGQHTCCCHGDHSTEPEDTVASVSECLSVASTHSFHSLSRASSSTSVSRSDDLPIRSQIMTNDQWAQFCRIYDRGSKWSRHYPASTPTTPSAP